MLSVEECEKFLRNGSLEANRSGNPNLRPSPAMVWGVGLCFVTLISICAAAGIGLMPLLSKRLYNRVLTFFVGLGVGSLSGSAVFHLIPQAFDLVGDGTSHEYLEKAIFIVAGVYLFFFTDKFLQFVIKVRNSSKSGEEGGGATNKGATMTPLVRVDLDRNGQGQGQAKAEADEAEGDEDDDDLASQAHGICVHEHPVSYKSGDSVIGTVAWMIIFGDGLHNLIDGLSIGAAFSESLLSGISVSVAVLCEEFPHELGDVAILISAGMSLRQALVYNLLSACTCYIGFVVGVLLGELAEAQIYIFALAGGMFLYISLASMVPEMNGKVEAELKKSSWRGLRCMTLQASGVLTGLLLMFLMSYYGSRIQF